jgi:hypothetical protein
VGGAVKLYIECLYFKMINQKFCVDAKSSSKKARLIVDRPISKKIERLQLLFTPTRSVLTDIDDN